MKIKIEISVGELLDKLSILKIKKVKIEDPQKLLEINKELKFLKETADVIRKTNEKEFDKFSLDTLKDRYFWDGETHAQEAFARASVFGATFRGETDYEMAQRLYNYSSDCWFMFSTPILSNGGTTRGLSLIHI